MPAGHRAQTLGADGTSLEDVGLVPHIASNTGTLGAMTTPVPAGTERDAPGEPAPPEARPAADDKPKRSPWSTIFNLVMMVIGGVALWWMMREIGWAEFEAMLYNVGWWFPIILALDLISLCFDAAALHAFMRPEARMIKYRRVLGAWSSGRAINVLTPGGGLGEITKATLLMTHAPRDRVLSSLVLVNLSMFYISVTVMLIGTPITILLVDLPHVVKVTVGLALAVIVPAMIGVAVLVHRGAVSSLVGVLQRARIVKPEMAKRMRARLVEVDRHIRELQKNRTAGTWKGILWVLASKIITWGSTILLVYAIGIMPRPAVVIGVLSVGVIIQWVSQIIPMGLGIADGGNYALFGLLGATGPQGILVTMMNRARSVIVALLGLVAMAILQITTRLAVSRMRDKIDVLRERAADGTLGDLAGEPVAAADSSAAR